MVLLDSYDSGTPGHLDTTDCVSAISLKRVSTGGPSSFSIS